jgi:hypothetical protein
MAIARHLIVEGSRSNVSNGEPDHAVQRPGFRNAPAKIFGFGSVWRKAISLTPLIYPNIVCSSAEGKARNV